MQDFRALGLRPQTPQTAPPIVIFWLRACPRGRPREHIFKSLVLASKPQVLESCPVLGSRTALLFEGLKFCRSAEKCFSRPFFLEIDGKFFLRPFLLGKHLHLCPWSLALDFFVSLALATSLVSSTPPLPNGIKIAILSKKKFQKIAQWRPPDPRL